MPGYYLNREENQEEEVAMMDLPSDSTRTPHTDGAVIFNPLLDAPPTPPPIMIHSYQHSYSYTTTTSGTIPSRGNISEPNYYYSSSFQSPRYFKQPHTQFFDSPGIAYELELQRRRRNKQNCRTMLFIVLLLLISWKSRESHRRDTSLTGINFDDNESGMETGGRIDGSILANGDAVAPLIGSNTSNITSATEAINHST